MTFKYISLFFFVLFVTPLYAQEDPLEGYWQIDRTDKKIGKDDVRWQGELLFSPEYSELKIFVSSGVTPTQTIGICKYELLKPSFTESMPMSIIPSEEGYSICTLFSSAVMTTERDGIFLRTEDGEVLLPIVAHWSSNVKEAELFAPKIGKISGISVGAQAQAADDILREAGYTESEMKIPSRYDALEANVQTRLFIRDALKNPPELDQQYPTEKTTYGRQAPLLPDLNVGDALLLQTLEMPDGQSLVFFIQREMIFEKEYEPK